MAVFANAFQAEAEHNLRSTFTRGFKCNIRALWQKTTYNIQYNQNRTPLRAVPDFPPDHTAHPCAPAIHWSYHRLQPF